MKPALFFVNLPHTQTNSKYVACAYTQKLVKLAPAMMDLGYTVHIIGGEENETQCDHYHVAVTESDRKRWFGDQDFHKEFFNITWGGDEPHWTEMNDSAITYIKDKYKKGDIICLIAGHCQKQIADAIPEAISVEYGIGYYGVFSDFKVFESYSHMHHVYGKQNTDAGGFYDSVIHNYFEPKDFSLGSGKGGYLLWMGRFIENKGPEIAVEVAKRLNMELVMAGQGAIQKGNTVESIDGSISFTGENLNHVGHVNAEERSKLMGDAVVTLMPTIYIEPFGGVSIESMMCGTPVVATDFGAFTETVKMPAGRRFRTIGEATEATRQCIKLHRGRIRDYAIKNFSTKVAAKKYDMYFEQLATLYGEGFYSDWYPEVNRFENA